MSKRIAIFACAAIACGGSSNPSQSSSGVCSTPNGLPIVFNPMYSEWDGMHTFQIPTFVKGVSPTSVTWSVSDPNLVSISPDPTTGGILLTMTNAPTNSGIGGQPWQITVTARANGSCGTSILTVTPSGEADDWHDGAVRYNDGVDLRPSDGGAIAPGQTAACTNCHGPTANGPFKDVAHTPEQIGGFSNADLDQIIRNGNPPAGGYFDNCITSRSNFQSFHQWSMTDEEFRGLIVYLRSLPPTPQQGSSNFGGQAGGSDGGC
jgi:hypothetical protein